jgi:6-phosphogluconate dehydrogenase
MGANLARNAIEKGHQVVGYDPNEWTRRELAEEGVEAAETLSDMVSGLTRPRVILVYVPHGDPTEAVCRELRPLLEKDDIVVDGGNSHWADSRRRHDSFADVGIRFLDVGTSGGVSGARHGASFMVGGDREAFGVVAPILRDLAIDDQATFFVGEPGSGHFVKLVHNAIEFGMVQAIGEGVELLQRSGYDLDLAGMFDSWMHGSAIRGWLVDLMGRALGDAEFGGLSSYVEDTGEVKWVLDWALQRDIPTPVVSASQTALMQYRDLDWPAAKAVALLRNQYGGHPVHAAVEAVAVRR